jgi:hypothetical protein
VLNRKYRNYIEFEVFPDIWSTEGDFKFKHEKPELQKGQGLFLAHAVG